MTGSFAETFNIQDRIKYQDLYLSVYQKVFSHKVIANENTFKVEVLNLEDNRKRDLLLSQYKKLSAFLPPILLRSVLYYRHIEKDNEILSELLHYIFFNKVMAIRDQVDTAKTDGQHIKYLNLIKEITEYTSFSYKTLYSDFDEILKEKAVAIAQMDDEENFITALAETKIVNYSLKGKAHSFYQLTHLGIIPGNKVEWLHRNETSADRIQWYHDHSIFNGGELDFDLPYMKMPQKNSPSGHPAFIKDPIFIKIKDMVLQAKETIFIDIFLMGGTLGGTLAEFLLDQTKEKLATNPAFKVVLLHDYSTHYNMNAEMLPVFEYINERIGNDEELKSAFYLLQANIQRHPPGIPFGFSDFISKTKDTFPVLQKMSSYYESKIDHSKVIVIDGNTNQPAAYLGSKNWTDHSGGYYFDDTLYIEGPAASLIQHSYIRDIEAALTNNPNEAQWFYHQEKNLDNRKYWSQREDILNYFRITKEEIPYRGTDRVRLAEADIDGSIKNVRNLIVDLIKNSQKNIYMEQLFLYDKYIVDALIKKKIQNRNIDIKIILDNNENFKLNGFPNTIFIKELKKFGIQIRTRNTISNKAKFPNGIERVYHQENHRKVMSSDGKRIIFGSSNLNPDTLQGSFRELGAEVFSSTLARSYEIKFQSTWSDPKKCMDLDIENFRLEIEDKKYSKSFSALINDIAAFLIRSKDKIERKN